MVDFKGGDGFDKIEIPELVGHGTNDSYIIKKSAAKKILNNIVPFTLPIDFELNYHMASHDMNVYWWDPPITKQGSECGVFDVSNTER
mgnify:CR=1 FL=1